MTAKEAKQQFAEKFAAADNNHDGKLTREEAQSGMPDVYAHFGEIDRKKKGYVTRKEIGQWYGLRFKEKQARQLEKPI
ncbi:EF-hand domain-containing protein [Cupriavidus necator]|uniref:EF-hand domain-containing protein n=1 Tax=Cupriavidus necator TaxID=106590 RepID=UPI000ACF1DE1|nr:EF-hand domain-containing protein [Cupriavidus necator]